MDFLLLSSAISPAEVQFKLAKATGFPSLPPIYALGFHYSKWEAETSARRALEFIDNFDSQGIPLDMLWFDIPATDDNRYFTLNPFTFDDWGLNELKDRMLTEGKRLVIITDPHIKVDENYFVWANGQSIDKTIVDGRYINIFIKDGK